MKMARFRRHKHGTGIRRRPINVLASVMTTMNLYCGVSSIFASIGQEFEKAALFIAGAIIFDMLDGFVARLTRSTSEFGKELDSLSDIVSFGVAPAVMVFVVYLQQQEDLLEVLTPRTESILGRAGAYVGIIYTICAALRLARFNTFQSDRWDSFIGLPSPAAGGTIAALILFLEYFAAAKGVDRYGIYAYYTLGPLVLLLAGLMVSTVLYPKGRLKRFIVAPKRAFVVLGFSAFAIAVVHFAVARSPYLVLFPAGMAYVLFGIFDSLIYHRNREAAIPGERPPSP